MLRLVSPTYVTQLRRVLDHLTRAGSGGSAGGSVEPHVRCVVAEHLGVGEEELAPEVSLRDDLAADSLEGKTALIAGDRVRTYGELVKSVEALVREREAEAEHPSRSRDLMPVRVRVVPPPGRPACDLQRADWLTPYTAQTIAEDALRNGPGARLEVSVPPDLSDAALAGFRDQLAWLDDRDIQVRVRRDRQLPPAAQRRPYAA